jgi:Tol biopolymer transport system component
MRPSRPTVVASRAHPMLVLSLIAFFGGCTDSTGVGPRATTSARPAPEIQDAAHNSGKRGFYFLPPVVSAPNATGQFDAALAPRVTACEWNGTACATVVADFTTSSGTGSEVVRVDALAQQYIVNWDTKTCTTGACTLDPTKTYRIVVTVADVELGHADVAVVNNGSGVKNVQTNDYVALVNERTLPVKFRAETGITAHVSVSPPNATVKVGSTQAFAATVTDLHGQPLFGRSVAWTSSDESIASVDGAGVATGVATGSVLVTATADGASGSAALIVQPAGPGGTIVVMSSRFGGWRIVIMNADGSNARLVTPFQPDDDQPVPDLSPDKSTVVFAHQRQVWKADVATGAVTQLTFEGVFTRYGKWSPDGSKIAFNSGRGGGHNLYTMNPDGSGVQQVTFDAGDEFEPTWSPDGKRLAFLSYRTGVQELYVVDIATGAERQVTFDAGTHNSPRWAPSGSLVAYMKDNTIWVVDVDAGTQPRQLTNPGYGETEPCFSPDGNYIAFNTNRSGASSSLWIMNIDGSSLHQFIPTPGSDTSCSWR